jgi:hypothetical protein
MNNRFGVALSPIAVAASLQILAQFPVIVDFAVENDPNGFVFIADGLMTGLNVDDAEAPHRQSDIVLDKKTVIVGATMDDLPVHGDQLIALNALSGVRMPGIGIKNAADSTHA